MHDCHHIFLLTQVWRSSLLLLVLLLLWTKMLLLLMLAGLLSVASCRCSWAAYAIRNALPTIELSSSAWKSK